MEGSNNIRNLDNYEALAYFYDELLGDEEAFNLWYEILDKYSSGKKTLELASGSGYFLRLLKNKGHDVIGSDLSEEMNEIARLKVDELGVKVLKLNMIDFKMDEKFDNIVCICDSLNYLELNEVKQMFKNVYDHLNPNGVFMVDMHHPERLNEFEEEYVEEGYLESGVPYIWNILADKYASKLRETFVFFTSDGTLKEFHEQNVFKIEDINDILDECGFKRYTYADFIENEKALFIGVKR